MNIQQTEAAASCLSQNHFVPQGNIMGWRPSESDMIHLSNYLFPV